MTENRQPMETSGAVRVSRARAAGVHGGEPVGRLVRAAGYALLVALMRVVVLVSFRRLCVSGRAHFPPRGAALVVANHPSTWTDAVVLDVALGRKLHFLALEELFHAWPGGWLLWFHGALPVRTHGTPAERAARNDATLAECERLLARGEVVAMFPEGLSRADGTLLPLRPGAARLALREAVRRGDAAFPVVPVGVEYRDRTAFQTDVRVRVGERVPIRDLLAPHAGAPIPDAAVAVLTERIARGLAECMPGTWPDAARDTVRALEDVAEAVGAERGPTTWEEWLGAGRDAAEAAHARELHQLARRHRRARSALGLTDRALAVRARGAGTRLFALCALLLPAGAGALLHALPARVLQRFARRYRTQPARMSFARIAGGLVLFPPWYALLGGLAVRFASLPMPLLPALWLAMALTGLAAVRVRPALQNALELARLLILSRRAPRLLARARGSFAALAREVRQGHARPATRAGVPVS